MKTDTKKPSKKTQKYLGDRMYLEVILMIILIPVITFFLMRVFNVS